MLLWNIAKQLAEIHSALDNALGDSDITHIENEGELRDRFPVQWAAEKLALLISKLEVAEGYKTHQGVEPKAQ